MNPILLLAIGLGVVLGSILWLRWHPFLALIAGAFAVASLTSDLHLREAMKTKYLGEAIRSETRSSWKEAVAEAKSSGSEFDAHRLREEARREVMRRVTPLRDHADRKAQEFVTGHSVVARITAAIGETGGKIGLLIALACVVGRCMLSSGAAERIVRSSLSIVGEEGAPVAFAMSSFVLGIPVFFDSVFLLTIPLAKATWLKLRKNYLLFTLALITGGTITHSLVPPTPGPLFVAQELGVNVGLMILVGIAVGLGCTSVGLLFAYWLNSRMEIPLRETPEAIAHLQRLSDRRLDELPSLARSLLPVLLPVVLISGITIYESMLDPSQSVPSWLRFLGDTNVALGIAAVIAMRIAYRYSSDSQQFVDQIQEAMQEAGLIILVCCGGGAFGAILQQSGIGGSIRSLTGSSPLDFALLPLAFFVTAVIRTAQGSATVAMLTAVEIIRSLVPDIDALSFHPVYLAVGIGCGSKPIPWMNDSGFWVICKMSGMTEQETLKTQSPMVSLMGFVGILLTMIGAWLVPLH